MKLSKKNIYIVILSLIIIVISFIGFNKFKQIENKKTDIIQGKTAIRTIETATFNNRSYIVGYNLKGEKINEIQVDCPDIKAGFSSTLEYKGSWYINALGGYSNRTKKVVEFIPKENKANTYDIAYGIISVASNDDYIFTTHSPANQSILTKYSKKDSSIVSKINLSGFVSHIKVFNDKIYAFSDSDNKDGKTIISIVNTDTMEIEKVIERKSELGTFDSIYFNNFIYFTSSRTSDDKNVSKTIYKFNPEDYLITNIELDANSPNQIKEHNGILYISHYNNFEKGSGNKLTKFNPITNENQIISFDHSLAQIEIKDDKLIVFDLEKIYIYNLENFELINKFDVASHRKDYRISGFLIDN